MLQRALETLAYPFDVLLRLELEVLHAACDVFCWELKPLTYELVHPVHPFTLFTCSPSPIIYTNHSSTPCRTFIGGCGR